VDAFRRTRRLSKSRFQASVFVELFIVEQKRNQQAVYRQVQYEPLSAPKQETSGLYFLRLNPFASARQGSEILLVSRPGAPAEHIGKRMGKRGLA
jgi:hypothetical protein